MRRVPAVRWLARVAVLLAFASARPMCTLGSPAHATPLTQAGAVPTPIHARAADGSLLQLQDSDGHADVGSTPRQQQRRQRVRSRQKATAQPALAAPIPSSADGQLQDSDGKADSIRQRQQRRRQRARSRQKAAAQLAADASLLQLQDSDSIPRLRRQGYRERSINKTIAYPLAAGRPGWRGAPRLGLLPHVLWQTYRDSSLPDAANDLALTWAEKNPGMVRVLHNDTQASWFVNRTFNHSVRSFYASFPLGVMRADFWRYAVLYARGGIYADVDTSCVRPLADWLPPKDDAARGLPLSDLYQTNLTWRTCSLVVGLENDDSFCQWAIAGAAGHPVLQAVLQLIEHRMQAASGVVNTSTLEFVHHHTGPTVWTDAILGLLRRETSIDLQPGRSASPAQAFKAVYSDARLFEEVHGRLGMCLVGQLFMQSLNVENRYGSQKGMDGSGGVHEGWEGWASWIAERQTVRNSSSPWRHRRAWLRL